MVIHVGLWTRSEEYKLWESQACVSESGWTNWPESQKAQSMFTYMTFNQSDNQWYIASLYCDFLMWLSASGYFLHSLHKCVFNTCSVEYWSLQETKVLQSMYARYDFQLIASRVQCPLQNVILQKLNYVNACKLFCHCFLLIYAESFCYIPPVTTCSNFCW